MFQPSIMQIEKNILKCNFEISQYYKKKYIKYDEDISKGFRKQSQRDPKF